MGGAVDTVKKVFSAAATVANPLAGVAAQVGGKIIQSGDPSGVQARDVFAPIAAGRTLVEGGKAAVQGGISVGQEIGLLPEDPTAPNIAAEDPAARASADAKARARAKRQAEVDILTGTPGRGGTILTDNYDYKV